MKQVREGGIYRKTRDPNLVRALDDDKCISYPCEVLNANRCMNRTGHVNRLQAFLLGGLCIWFQYVRALIIDYWKMNTTIVVQ